MRTLLLLGLAAGACVMSNTARAAESSADAAASAAAQQAGTSYTPPSYQGTGYPGDAYYQDGYYQGGAYQGGYDPERSYRYDSRYSDADMARLCRSDNGLGGAAAGAVVGGVAGNVIAGRGNRGLGTAVGAVAGAAIGGTIDREADKRRCEDYHRRVAYEREYRDYYNRHYGAQGYPQGRDPQGYYQGTYGYYTVPETVVTTEYVPYETVTTTTETTYDYAYPQRRAVRKAAKRPPLVLK